MCLNLWFHCRILVYTRIIIVIFGDYLTFQQNILCTFLRRLNQILTCYSPKGQLDDNIDCTLSLAIFCRFFGEGGGTIENSGSDQTSRFLPAETGAVRPASYVYLLGIATAAGMLTHRRSGKKLPALRLSAVNWEVQKQLAVNHAWLVTLLVPTFSATTVRLLVCFSITDTFVSFLLAQVPLKRKFNLNYNQTEFQRRSKHSAYIKTTSRLMLYTKIIAATTEVSVWNTKHHSLANKRAI